MFYTFQLLDCVDGLAMRTKLVHPKWHLLTRRVYIILDFSLTKLTQA